MTGYQSERDIMLHIAHHQYYWQQRMKTRDKERSGPVSSTLTMSWKDFLMRLTLMSSLPVLRLNEPHRPRHLETLQLLVTDRWNSLFLKKTTGLPKSGNRSLNDSVKELEREVSGKKKMPEKAQHPIKRRKKNQMTMVHIKVLLMLTLKVTPGFLLPFQTRLSQKPCREKLHGRRHPYFRIIRPPPDSPHPHQPIIRRRKEKVQINRRWKNWKHLPSVELANGPRTWCVKLANGPRIWCVMPTQPKRYTTLLRTISFKIGKHAMVSKTRWPTWMSECEGLSLYPCHVLVSPLWLCLLPGLPISGRGLWSPHLQLLVWAWWQFLPDSIASKDSTIDTTDLVFDTLGQEANIGSHMSEQSDYRMAAFDDLIDKCTKGTKVGNSYLQSFLKQGIEEYKFADFVHTLPGKDAFPLSRSITVSIRIQTHHFQFVDHLFSSIASIMTWLRMNVPASWSCADPFCSAKTSSRSASSKILTTLLRAKKIYLSFFTPNLGKVNRNHALEVTWNICPGSEKILTVGPPYLVFRNGAHIVALCEAHDPFGGIARH